jgi:tetratricopeptide (TPR) repeat protein
MTDAMLERAQQLIQLHRYKDAEKELRIVLSQNPNLPEALALFSVCLAEQGQLEEALTTIRSAISQEPDSDYLLYLHALYLFKSDKLKEAERSIQNAIAFDPLKADYFGLLAAIKLSQKDWTKGLESANQGLSIDPGNLQCLNMRSRALYKLDRKEEAYSTVQEALNQDPENELTHTNLGWSLLEKGDHIKALEHFREALKINPQYDYAKAGLMEGLKARYLFYRLFLKYAFWISNFKGKGQWAIIIGLYFGFKLIDKVADSNAGLALILKPIVYLYIAFAISTWIIVPLSNLFLRLNIYGRFALSKHEKYASNFVGVAFLIGVSGLLYYLFSNAFFFFLLGIIGITMMIPLSSMFTPEKNRSKYLLMGYTALLGFFAALTLIQNAMTQEVSIAFPVYTFGVVIYGWVANAIFIKV